MKVYKQKDGRQFIVYKDEDGKYHSKSYARYLMEQHLGRKLLPTEHVHHKDHNKLNDVIDNLEVKNSIEHLREHFKKEDTIEHCYMCGKEIIVNTVRKCQHYRKKNKNPDKWFCSRHCSGIFGKQCQLNNMVCWYSGYYTCLSRK